MTGSESASKRTGTIIGFVLLGVLVGFSLWKNAALQSRVNELEVTVSAAIEEQARASQETNSAIAALESRLAYFEAADPAFELPDSPDLEALAKLLTGYYELQTSTPYIQSDEDPDTYTIHHVAVEMKYENIGTIVNVGLAMDGYMPVGAYFDYDNDGLIDADMALNFVGEIPVIGKRLRDAYDPRAAQRLYRIFSDEYPDAEFTSAEDMSGEAAKQSGLLWSFVTSHYDAMQSWVVKALSEDQSPPE